jgi:hypothetical protein
MSELTVEQLAFHRISWPDNECATVRISLDDILCLILKHCCLCVWNGHHEQRTAKFKTSEILISKDRDPLDRQGMRLVYSPRL